MLEILLSHEAHRDLVEIEDYTARQWGDAQAEKYLRSIAEALQRLAENPGIGHQRPDIPPPYLAFSIGGHVLVYRINQPEKRLEVLNILHAAMDIRKRLREALIRQHGKSGGSR